MGGGGRLNSWDLRWLADVSASGPPPPRLGNHWGRPWKALFVLACPTHVFLFLKGHSNFRVFYWVLILFSMYWVDSVAVVVSKAFGLGNGSQCKFAHGCAQCISAITHIAVCGFLESVKMFARRCQNN